MADLANAVVNQDHLLLIGRIAMQDTLSVMVETTLWCACSRDSREERTIAKHPYFLAVFYLAVFTFAVKIQLFVFLSENAPQSLVLTFSFIRRRGVRAPASVFMLSITVVLFSISTVLWALVVTQLFQGFRVMLLHNDASDLERGVDERYQLLGQKSVFMEGLFLLTVSALNSLVN